MMQSEILNCCFIFLLFTHMTNGVIEEVCIPFKQGPPGPAGPPGAPGRDSQCICDTSEFSQLREQLREQQEQIQSLTRQLQEQKPVVNITKNNSNQSSVSIYYARIKEIVKTVIGKQNNCPAGLSDGRIPDHEITASSTYNDSLDYAADLARLRNVPDEGDIGAWKSKSVKRIREIGCYLTLRDYVSNYGSVTNFTVKCPANCRYDSYYQRLVYGSKVYMDRSSICMAAIHDGKITAKEGGYVFVHRKPRRVYQQSTQYHITSSRYTADTGPFWFLEGNGLEWIQVDFGTPTPLTGVITQGRPTSREEWVKTYQISFGNSTDELETMTFNNVTKVFQANVDMFTPVKNMFINPVRARFVRLIPLSWNNAIALRMEYLTC